ncbi:TIGR04283 family arsenosugar biosynthesis glycosyltransferase [Marinobacter sp. M216]|uniref:TIGR04283 family arsenosugar biosynthesis glycosyltransferase n=1 Tax=Marinobacter albus TaxID=3030833 RepID=A0ABT7HHI2_9GAMM|nr:TIGR04283 family arsenosugar biosynthesis glycosyltransferase [Marinobacter sp. M216]MDK9558955.1 TIGR04283 family arsenosugar biosynthesis glycosyltransferase [Marinobacter sp. M216]
MPDPFSLSVIVPVWREAPGIESSLKALASIREAGHQVIVVDAGSDDGTAVLAGPLCDRVLVSERGRGAQMNAGAAAAGGNLLLFLHADTRLPADAVTQLETFMTSRSAWGRFDVRLSGRRALFRVIAWFMNQRSRLTGVCTGDQAMFVRRDAFEALGGFRAQPLMEDVEFSRRLCLVSRPYCIHSPVITDSRRWEKLGPWRTIFLMWRLRWRYWRGESPESLAQAYRSDVRNA